MKFVEAAERCEDCKFWLPKDVNNGFCRRFPPLPVLRVSDSNGYPVTWKMDWCGEFKRKEKL